MDRIAKEGEIREELEGDRVRIDESVLENQISQSMGLIINSNYPTIYGIGYNQWIDYNQP